VHSRVKEGGGRGAHLGEEEEEVAMAIVMMALTCSRTIKMRQ